jgi:hypothetical protein
MDTLSSTNPRPSPTDIYCRKCRYCLRGLDSHRCPECGQPFDPNDPTTFLTLATMRWAWQSIAAAVCLGSFAVSPALMIACCRAFDFYVVSLVPFLLIHEFILCVACAVLASMGMNRGAEKSRTLAAFVLYGLMIAFTVWLALAGLVLRLLDI